MEHKTEYKEMAKSFDKCVEALAYYLNFNTENGVSYVPENVLKSTVNTYKLLSKLWQDGEQSVKA